MPEDLYDQLSRLERRIMDAIYRLGEAPVADVVRVLDAADVSESIRVTMSNLENKGFLQHRREGRRNIYAPTIAEEEARRSVVDRVLDTFYEGSAASAILNLLERDTGLTEEDVKEIRRRIRAAEQAEGGGSSDAVAGREIGEDG